MSEGSRETPPTGAMDRFGSEVAFPPGLSDKDKQLVRQQGELQGAISKEQIEGFASAYQEAKALVSDQARLAALTPGMVHDLILRFGALVEERNAKGFRKTPVMFPDHTLAVSPDSIERALGRIHKSGLPWNRLMFVVPGFGSGNSVA